MPVHLWLARSKDIRARALLKACLWLSSASTDYISFGTVQNPEKQLPFSNTAAPADVCQSKGVDGLCGYGDTPLIPSTNSAGDGTLDIVRLSTELRELRHETTRLQESTCVCYLLTSWAWQFCFDTSSFLVAFVLSGLSPLRVLDVLDIALTAFLRDFWECSLSPGIALTDFTWHKWVAQRGRGIAQPRAFPDWIKTW